MAPLTLQLSTFPIMKGMNSRCSVGSSVVVVVGERVGFVVALKEGIVVSGGAFVVVRVGHEPERARQILKSGGFYREGKRNHR